MENLPQRGKDTKPGARKVDVPTGVLPSSELQAQIALKESQARNQAILSALPDLMFINSREGDFLDYHAPDPSILLFSPEVFLGRNTKDLFPPHQSKAFMAAYRDAIDKGEVQIVDYSLEIDGESHYFEARVVAVDSERVLSIIRNVSERKRVEQKLFEEEKRFHELADLLPETAYETDITGHITFLSEAGLRTFGYVPSDLNKGLNIMDLIAPQQRAAVKKARAKILESHVEMKMQSYGIRKNGTQLPIIIHSDAIMHEDHCHGTRGVIVDITEQKRAEQTLADTKAMLEAAFDQNPTPMVLVSVPDRILRMINPPCMELLGVFDQICPIGQPITDLDFTWNEYTLDDKLIDRSESPLMLAIKGIKTFKREIKIIRKDGTERIVQVHGTPVYNAFGKHIASMVILRDLTDSAHHTHS